MTVECPNPHCENGTIAMRDYDVILDRGTRIISHMLTMEPLVRGLAVCWFVPMCVAMVVLTILHIGPSLSSFTSVILISIAFSATYLLIYYSTPRIPVTVYMCRGCRYTWSTRDRWPELQAKMVKGQKNEIIFQRTAGTKRNLGIALVRYAGTVLSLQGDTVQAEALCNEALPLLRKANLVSMIPSAQATIAMATFYRGDVVGAYNLYSASFRAIEQNRDWHRRALMMGNLGVLQFYCNEHKVAHETLRESVRLAMKLEEDRFVAVSLVGLARIAGTLAQPVRAVRLYGAVRRIRSADDSLLIPPFIQQLYDQAVASVRAQLSEEDFQTAWAEGEAMDVEQAVAYALSEETPVPVAVG